jgi:tripartite-type tricarboxylate transporter receptor subunit TctC
MHFCKRELAALMLLSSALPMAVMGSEVDALYPQRPITLVVGYPPGGGADALARLLAKHMANQLGQKVLVENRPGAASNIAADSVARAIPDGYTLYISTRPNTIHKSMYGSFDFELADDLTPVAVLATVPNVIVAAKQGPIANLRDLITRAQADPGSLTYGSSGVGSDPHLAAELFQQATQTKLLHVSYRGGAQALVDAISGRVDLLFITLPAALAHIQAGSVRAVAVMSRRRAAAISHVPTAEEAGIVGLGLETWFGLMAPGGTPPHITERLNASVNTVLNIPQLQKAFMERGYVAPLGPNTPGTLRDLIAEETQRWAAILEAQNIKPAQ